MAFTSATAAPALATPSRCTADFSLIPVCVFLSSNVVNIVLIRLLGYTMMWPTPRSWAYLIYHARLQLDNPTDDIPDRHAKHLLLPASS